MFFINQWDSKRRIRKASCGRFSRRGSPNPSCPTIYRYFLISNTEIFMFLHKYFLFYIDSTILSLFSNIFFIARHPPLYFAASYQISAPLFRLFPAPCPQSARQDSHSVHHSHLFHSSSPAAYSPHTRLRLNTLR